MFSRLFALFSSACQPHFFDPDWYLDTYEDVAASGMNPLKHYVRHGCSEGRLPCFMVTVDRERDVRWGLAQDGDAALARFAHNTLTDQSEADRIWACLACARSAARTGDWDTAARWMGTLDPQRDIIDGFCQLDPSLLAIESALRAGQFDRARDHLTRALQRFGAQPDLWLTQANMAAAEKGIGTDWHRALDEMYTAAGLSPITVHSDTSDMSPFDRLTSAARPKRTWRTTPLVSVIMPARNADLTIATALRSLLAQTWIALDIIVVDNGSQDKTASIARQLADQDSRIRVFDGSAAQGTYAARNLGMEQARGQFVTVLDADDWAHPERIARQARALLRRPAHVMATLSCWVRTTSDLHFSRWWKDDGLVHHDISSLMVRAEARERLGYWDRVRVGADTEYIARLKAVFGAQAIRDVLPGVPLSFGRLSERSLTQATATTIDSYLLGPRRDYDHASQRWHTRLRDGHDLPLPSHPACRPFPVPDALALEPADPPVADPRADWLATSDMFDNRWYMQTYPELRAANADGVRHYLESGEADGKSPGPGFSPSAYQMAYGPVHGSALQHFLATGQAEGHAPLPVFNGAVPKEDGGRHILIFGHQARLEIFGAERSLLDILDTALAADVTPSVVLPHILNHDYLEALKQRCHRVYVRPYAWAFGDVPPPPQTVADLAQLIRDTGTSEVHLNTVVLEAPLYAARAAAVPTVVHVHELPATDPRLCMGLGRTASEIRDRLLDQADRLVANAQPVLDWLEAGPNRTILVPNRIDPALFDVPFAPGSQVRVGLVGSLVAKKGIRDVITLAGLCRAAKLPVRFVLVGPETPDLAQLAPLPENVSHVGYVEHPIDAIGHCDVVLSLSHVAESFGRTVLEAMAAGRPVICYDRGTPPDLVGRDGGAGRVVQADSCDAVCHALAELVSASHPLDQLSKEARIRAMAHQKDAHKQAGLLFETDVSKRSAGAG